MPRKLLSLTFLFLSLVSGLAPAELVIGNRTTDLDPNVAAELTLLQAFNSAANQVQTTVNSSVMGDAQKQSFSDAVAKANLSTPLSVAVDRSDFFPSFGYVGTGLAAGFFNEGTSLSAEAQNQLPALGFGAQGAFMLGIRGKRLGIRRIAFPSGDRLYFYFSGMSLSGGWSNTTVSFFNLGFDIQYQALLPTTGFYARWGGLRWRAGVHYTTNDVTYSGSVDQRAVAAAESSVAEVRAHFDYLVSAQTTNVSVPFEISTSATILSFITLYGGGGADLNFGITRISGSGSGPITINYDGSITKSNLFSGTATLDLNDGTGSILPLIVGRGFVGGQLTFGDVSVGADYSVLTSGTQIMSGWLRYAIDPYLH